MAIALTRVNLNESVPTFPTYDEVGLQRCIYKNEIFLYTGEKERIHHEIYNSMDYLLDNFKNADRYNYFMFSRLDNVKLMDFVNWMNNLTARGYLVLNNIGLKENVAVVYLTEDLEKRMDKTVQGIALLTDDDNKLIIQVEVSKKC